MASRSNGTYVYVGAAPWMTGGVGGVFRRAVGNGGWEALDKGLPERTEVRAITIHPDDPEIVFIGTNTGPYRSTDSGGRWERLGFPKDGGEVWSIAVHPTNSRILYAGASPVAVYRSDDGGDTWRKLASSTTLPPQVKMAFACRVMRLAVDPARPNEVYAALEVGGVMRSLDGGEHWSNCSADLLKLAQQPHLKSKIQSDTENEGMLDAHALAVSSARAGTVFLAVRMGLFESADQAASWHDMEVGRFSPLTYGRDVRVSPQDPNVLYAALSPAARSEDGSIYRSADLGKTWTRFDRGIKANSTMMAVALHPKDPNQVYGVSRHGQVFGTQDGGHTWWEEALPDGVADVYTVACA